MAKPEKSGSPIHDRAEGVIGDDHEHTSEIRRRANEIINGDEWPLDDVDLSSVIFQTATRVRRTNGRARTGSDGRTVVEVAEHVIENAGWDAADQVIRHELVHAWQRQHRGETIELPTGSIVQNVDIGHTGSWYEWEKLLDISRTNRYYEHSPSDFNYIIDCRSCEFWEGRYRLCRYVRLAASGRLSCPICGSLLYLARPDDLLALDHSGNYDDEFLKWFVSDDFEPGRIDPDNYAQGD